MIIYIGKYLNFLKSKNTKVIQTRSPGELSVAGVRVKADFH